MQLLDLFIITRGLGHWGLSGACRWGGGGGFLTEQKIPLKNVPGVLKRKKMGGGGGGGSLLILFSKMFLWFWNACKK